MALSTGSLLAGRYEITAPVAVGGMGEVWRARDRVLNRTVAAKVLRSEYTGDPNFLARFRNEARHTAALTHPNIASVYDYGETRDENGATVAYLVMEFVEGQTLVSILYEEGRLPVDWTLHVLGQAADGLSAAHRAGVVHRDIKPGNLMVRPDGVVKLTDFGIAQARDATPLTRTGMVVGTAQYLSPEQAQGLEVAATSDVYSLGVVAYECLAGSRPFDGTSQIAIALAHINQPPPPLPADVPPAVQTMISRALAKHPDDRFADGGAFAEAIRVVEAGGRPPGGLATGAVAGGAIAAAGATTDLLDIPEGDGTRVLSGSAATGATAAVGPYTRSRPMPPLHGPPDDDDEYDDYYADEQPARRRRWPWLVAALVVLVLLGGGAWYVLTRDDGTGGSGSGRTSASSASSSTGEVLVDTNGFIGEDADAVQKDLTDKGLEVTRQNATTAQLRALGRPLDPGTVAGSTPANQSVPKGSQVTLLVAPNGYRPAGGASTTAASTTTGARTTTSAPTGATTTSAAPTTTAGTTTTTAGTSTTVGGGSSAPGATTSPAADNGAAGGPPAPGVGP